MANFSSLNTVSQGQARGLNVSYNLVLVILTTFFAMGLLSNQVSYAFVPVLYLVSLKCFRLQLTSLRTALLVVTLMLAAYGTGLGILNGHKPEFVIRFSTPFFVFSIFSHSSTFGPILFRYRRMISLFCFMFSLFVFLLTKLGLTQLSLALLKGWTVSFDTSSAVSIWHYFALAISLTVLVEFFWARKTGNSLAFAALAVSTIVLLAQTTNTSAFTLAIVFGVLVALLPLLRLSFMTYPIFFAIFLLTLDYLTFQAISGWILKLLNVHAVGDAGNFVRLIQIDYFVNSISIFGNGFGGELDFRFYEIKQRQNSHELFPYASELPILNVIHGGGLLAVIWFLLILYVTFQLVANLKSQSGEVQTLAFFGCSCMLVLIGSISNPFLFSPISMLLLVAGLDCLEAQRQENQNN